MPLYSRSDLVAVTVPVADFKGCGNLHRRPVVNGAPAKIWALDCPPCENHLRHSDQWSTTLSELPETYDEKLVREDFEKRGALDERKLMAIALAKMNGIPIPETISGMLGGTPQIPGMLECPSGHAAPPGQKFCGECGSPMSTPVTKAALEAPERPAGPPAADPSPSQGDKARRLQDRRLEELQAIAGAMGLDAEGTRPELIDRIRAAKTAAKAA